MKKTLLQTVLMGGVLLLVALASCKKETATTYSVESIKFANSKYGVDESDNSLNLKAQLVAVPEGLLDTAKITWRVIPEGAATVKDNCLIPNEMGSVLVRATVQNKSAECKVIIYGSLKDWHNRPYRTVKIGKYIWMAENLDASVYEDKDGNSLGLVNRIDDVKALQTYTPYAVYAVKKENWRNDSKDAKVTDDVRVKFGYMYNWAAAVGMEKEKAIIGTYEFLTFRQGICPKGWHLPISKEIDDLIETAQGRDEAGGRLKSTSGWYDNGNGTDDFGFDVAPSGFCGSGTMEVVDVGGSAYFWAATPALDNDPKVNLFISVSAERNSITKAYISKSVACGVRCVKDY